MTHPDEVDGRECDVGGELAKLAAIVEAALGTNTGAFNA